MKKIETKVIKYEAKKSMVARQLEKRLPCGDAGAQGLGTFYAESSIGYGIESKEEMFAIASVHQKNKIAFGANAPNAKKFLNTPLGGQTGSMQLANAAMINALTGGMITVMGQTNGMEQNRQWFLRLIWIKHPTENSCLK